MKEDATTCYLIHLVGIGNSNVTFANQPHVAIHAAMIGEVESGLFLAGRIGLVVAIVSHHGYQTVIASLDICLRKIHDDGQISAFVLLHQLTIHVDVLLTHDGFKVNSHVFPLHVSGHGEMFPVPNDALIVATTAGFIGYEHGCMGSANHFPLAVIEVQGFCSLHVTAIETPSLVEIINHTTAAFQRKQTSNGVCGKAPADSHCQQANHRYNSSAHIFRFVYYILAEQNQ